MRTVRCCDGCKRMATTVRSIGCKWAAAAVYSSDCKRAAEARAGSDGVGSDYRRRAREVVRNCWAAHSDCCDVTAVTYRDGSHPRCRRDSWARTQHRHRDFDHWRCLDDASPYPDDASDRTF